MNIVFGGSFNPPTKAHYEMCKFLLNNFNIENLIILPVSDSYDKNSIINSYHRINMINIMIKDLKNTKIENIEIEKKYTGTYQSLEYLSRLYKDIYFVMGADNLQRFDEWINYEKLINEFKFIVFQRNNINIDELINNKYEKYKNNFIIIDFKENISSTDVRNDLLNNKNNLLEGIYDYIVNNNLYIKEAQ